MAKSALDSAMYSGRVRILNPDVSNAYLEILLILSTALKEIFFKNFDVSNTNLNQNFLKSIFETITSPKRIPACKRESEFFGSFFLNFLGFF